MKAKYIWIGLLSISFCCGHIFAQKPPSRYYGSIDKNKKVFLSKEEVSIQDYYDILGVLKQEYGEDSELYRFLIPDTAKFRELYGFPFFYMKKGVHYKSIESNFIREQQRILPMVAISYEQVKVCCQLIEEGLNMRDSIRNKSRTKSYTWQCSLPEKADYEMALNSKKAEITQKAALSPLQVKYTKRRYAINSYIIKPHYGNSISGLTDNIAEYMQDGMVVEGGKNTTLKFVEEKDCENPIGFRIKLTVVSKK